MVPITDATPRMFGGSNSLLIVVGATDASGIRTVFSQYLPVGTSLVDLYNIGVDVVVPSIQQTPGVPLTGVFDYHNGTPAPRL